MHYSEKVLFESAYMYLYSGHKHSCRVAFRGREDHSLLKYLTSKKYKITDCNGSEIKSIWKHDVAMLSDLNMRPEDIVELGAKVNKIMSPHGILMITMDVGNDNIPSKDVLINDVVNPLLELGFIIQGAPESFDGELFNSNLQVQQKHLPDNNKHPYALVCLRKENK